MIIKECHIENFGVLSDLSFKFIDGVNVIKEDNGWGKSTLAVFIKCMFYGMEYTKKRKKLPENKKYMPWNGGKCGGWLVFSVKDKTYRVTRYFGAKEADCEFELYDLTTNLPSRDYSENLGAELFGIDRASFERSIFIKLDSEQSKPELSGSISAKLNNLVYNTDDMNNYETAAEALDKAASAIVPKRGANGLIGKTEEEIRRVKDALADCDNAERGIKVQRGKINAADEKIAALREKSAAVSAELKNIELLEKKERYRRLSEAVTALDGRRAELAEFFRNGVPSEEELDMRARETNELDKYKSRAAEITASEEKRRFLAETEDVFAGNIPTDAEMDLYAADFDRSVKLSEEIDDISEQINDINAKRQKASRLRIAKIIGFTLIAVEWIVLLFVFSFDMTGKIVCASFAAVGFCLAALFAFIQINESRIDEAKPLKDKREALETERGKCMENLRAVSSDSGNTAAALSAMQRRLGKYNEFKRDVEIYDRAAAAAKRTEEDLIPFLAKYDADGETYFDMVQNIRGKLFEYTDAEEDYRRAAAEIRYFMAENGEELLMESVHAPKAPRVELEAAEESCRAKINLLTAERARAEQELERFAETADKRQELESRLCALNERRDELSEKHGILTDALKYLKQAREDLNMSYMTAMRDAFEKYMRMIEPERDDIVLTAKLETRIVNGGCQWEEEYHSRGYADMVNICTRLALADAMYKDEKPPLILDDPFVNLDEKKTERALEFLRRVGYERQVFYFTCHKSRSMT